MNIRVVHIPHSLTTDSVVIPAVVDAVTESIFRFLVKRHGLHCNKLVLKDTILGESLRSRGLLIQEPRFVKSNQPEYAVQLGKRIFRDLVMTSYFASKRDPQRRHTWKKDNYAIMRKWHLSIKRLNLSAVIFHDHLSDEFIAKFSTSRLAFVYVNLGSRSTNDDRYTHYLRYLERSPFVRYVVLTDISDVEIKLNVFSRMHDLDQNTGIQHIFVGQDVVNNKAVGSNAWMRNVMYKCFKVNGRKKEKPAKVKALNSRSMLLNAGVVGGARHPLLRMLRELVSIMQSLPVKHNCNMAALNYILHTRFRSVLFTGYPLTSSFLAGESFTEDIFIKHK